MRKININPDKKYINYMYVDQRGFRCFKIVRSRDLIDNNDNPKAEFIQNMRF